MSVDCQDTSGENQTLADGYTPAGQLSPFPCVEAAQSRGTVGPNGHLTPFFSHMVQVVTSARIPGLLSHRSWQSVSSGAQSCPFVIDS